MKYSMYKPKVKKPYTGPPRPNLMTHEKRLKETTVTIDQQQRMIDELRNRVVDLETKLARQNNYLSELHNQLFNLKNR